MKGYVRVVDVEVPFDGQKVQGQLEQLLYPDLLRLQGKEGGEVLSEYAGFLPRYVRSLSPILDAAGAPVPMEVICSAAYFSPLVALIMQQHMEAALSATHPLSSGQSEG